MICSKVLQGFSEHFKKSFEFYFCSKVLQGGQNNSLSFFCRFAPTAPRCSIAVAYRAGIARARAHISPASIENALEQYGAGWSSVFVGFRNIEVGS